jgi:hypothetical protein
VPRCRLSPIPQSESFSVRGLIGDGFMPLDCSQLMLVIVLNQILRNQEWNSNWCVVRVWNRGCPSFPRRRKSRMQHWIPACAGMTEPENRRVPEHYPIWTKPARSFGPARLPPGDRRFENSAGLSKPAGVAKPAVHRHRARMEPFHFGAFLLSFPNRFTAGTGPPGSLVLLTPCCCLSATLELMRTLRCIPQKCG